MLGLSSKELDYLTNLFKGYPEIEKVVLFGSRAKGNNKPGSDVDLAVFGQNLDDIIWRIHDHLEEESPMPYFFDVLAYDSIQNSELREHINRVGISIYEPNAAKAV